MVFFNIHFYFPEFKFTLGPYLPNLCSIQCIRLLKMSLAFQNYCGPITTPSLKVANKMNITILFKCYLCVLNSIIVKSFSEKLLYNKREMVDQHYQMDLSHLYYTEG